MGFLLRGHGSPQGLPKGGGHVSTGFHSGGSRPIVIIHTQGRNEHVPEVLSCMNVPVKHGTAFWTRPDTVRQLKVPVDASAPVTGLRTREKPVRVPHEGIVLLAFPFQPSPELTETKVHNGLTKVQ